MKCDADPQADVLCMRNALDEQSEVYMMPQERLMCRHRSDHKCRCKCMSDVASVKR